MMFSDTMRAMDDAGYWRREAERIKVVNAELLATCELFTKAAHDARDALNSAGLPCPSSIAFAAERARATIAKVQQ